MVGGGAGVLVVIYTTTLVLTKLVYLLVFLPGNSNSSSKTTACSRNMGVDIAASGSNIRRTRVRAGSGNRVSGGDCNALVSCVPTGVSGVRLRGGGNALSVGSCAPASGGNGADTARCAVMNCRSFSLRNNVTSGVTGGTTDVSFAGIVALSNSGLTSCKLSGPESAIAMACASGAGTVVCINSSTPRGTKACVGFNDGSAICLITGSSISTFSCNLASLVDLAVGSTTSSGSGDRTSSVRVSNSGFSGAVALGPGSSGGGSTSCIVADPIRYCTGRGRDDLITNNVENLCTLAMGVIGPSSSRLSDMNLSGPCTGVGTICPSAAIDLETSGPSNSNGIYLVGRNKGVMCAVSTRGIP